MNIILYVGMSANLKAPSSVSQGDMLYRHLQIGVNVLLLAWGA